MDEIFGRLFPPEIVSLKQSLFKMLHWIQYCTAQLPKYKIYHLDNIDVIFKGHKGENTQDVENLRHVEDD